MIKHDIPPHICPKLIKGKFPKKLVKILINYKINVYPTVDMIKNNDAYDVPIFQVSFK